MAIEIGDFDIEPTPWNWGQIVDKDQRPLETIEAVCQAMTDSAMFSQSTELWSVFSSAGDTPVICYTGNGPRSKANADFITHACNNYHYFVSTINRLGDELAIEREKYAELRKVYVKLWCAHLELTLDNIADLMAEMEMEPTDAPKFIPQLQELWDKLHADKPGTGSDDK
jgi:hypothetical protein